MAEALAVVGIVSSIIQIVDFSSKVVKRLDDFASSVGEVPRAFRHINTELPLIIDSLRRIQEHARDGNLDKVTVDALDPVIKNCHLEITRLENILDKTVPSVGASSWDRRKKALLSLGKDKDVEEIADSLSRYVRVLTLYQALEGSKPGSQPLSQPDQVRPQYFTLIPFDRNPHFVDREDIFKQIDESFKVKEGSQPKAALFGLGGIGKSQIALEYCFRKKENDPDCSVFWVQAATVARFEETYKRIATECRIVTQEATQVDITLLVKDWLETRHEGRWLMVVDNVDDADVFFRESTGNKKTLSQYIPRTGKGSLLFTTRSRDIAVDLILPVTPISIPVLTKSEGRRLLCSRVAGDHSEESVVELLEELEYIPLAITQAAAFMSKRRRTISHYLELYRKSDSARVRMLSYEFSDHARQHNSMESVAKTWIISFESIRRGNPRSADLLSLMCFFDRHAIPSALLYEEEEDILDFEDTVSVLCAFSLIESDEAETSFDMHNLVQLATKLWLIDENKGEEDRWAFEALSSLARKFPAPLHHPTPEYWKIAGDFLPHAQLILTHPFKSQREEIDLARAALLLSVSRYVHWRGAYMESKLKVEESFKIRERILGERHPDTLKSLGQLGWTYPYISIPGGERKSEEACRRCFELRREVLGEDHPETIDCLSDLAGAMEIQGRFQESEKMQRQAFESSKRVLGPEHLDTLNCLSHLASVLYGLKAYEEAETALRKVVQTKIRLLGEENPSALSDWVSLGIILSDQKNNEAEEVFKRVLELEVKVYGKAHPETLLTLGYLVLLFEREMKYESIRELSRWFSEEPKPVSSNYDLASRSGHNWLRVLKRFSFQVPDYFSGSSSSSSHSDDEEEGEVVEGSDEEKRNDNH